MILRDAARHLTPNGVLVVECGPGRLLEVGRDGKIAVSLWLARDPRVQIANDVREVA